MRMTPCHSTGKRYLKCTHAVWGSKWTPRLLRHSGRSLPAGVPPLFGPESEHSVPTASHTMFLLTPPKIPSSIVHFSDNC